MNKLLRFDWILRIRTSDPLFIIVLIQPIYIIWMYKIVRLGEKHLHRKQNKVFLLSCLVLFICIIIAFIPLDDIFGNTSIIRTIDPSDDIFETILICLIMASWLYCAIYSTIMTFKTEESLDEDFIPTIQDKIFRFFQITYWIFGIWIVQPKINDLENKINKTSL
jgi:hypothetical protein